MKSLILALVTLVSSTQAQAAAHLSLSTHPSLGTAEAVIYFDKASKMGPKLLDAVKLSHDFEEVKNPWVVPGTVFKSKVPGIMLTKGSLDSIELTITMTAKDSGSLSSGTNALIVGFGKNGSDVGDVLHRALLSSRSTHVLTKDRPGKVIEPRDDQAVILTNISFSGEYISCGSVMYGESRGQCSLTLDR